MTKSIQKIFLLLTAFVLFISIAPGTALTAKAAEKESYLTVDEAMDWLDSTVGEMRGDGQCIAFIKDYYQVLTGYLPTGNACEYAYNTLPPGFGWKRIKGEKNLKKGDIMIWTHGTGGNGHAAIYGGDGKYYHQKWTGKYVEIIGKAYLGGFAIRRSGSFARYWGVIRPNFRSESMFTEMNSSYRLKNAYSGSYLTAKNSSELTTRHLRSLNAKNQLFAADKDDAGYEISPLSTSAVLGTKFETGKTSSGVKVNLFKDSGTDDCRWRFQKTSGGYVIRNVYNPTLCITANKVTGRLTLEKYTGAKNQKWKTEEINTVSYDANGGWNIPKNTTAENGDPHKVSSKTPDRIGYKFLGWAKTKNAKKATFLSGSSIIPDKNTTLYAVWKKNKKYEIASAKLSETEYTYDGKLKTPSVTVKDTNGNTLREGTDYKLSYPKGRTNVGKYKVTVTYMGKFSGTDKLYFTVLPASTQITSLISEGKKLVVKYKKQAEKANGYAIQYSTSPDFEKAETTTVVVESIKRTAKTIKNLTPDTKWYVRVCTVNNGKDKTFYSEWSDIKSIMM